MKEDQRFFYHLGEIDFAALGEGMPRADDQGHFVAVNRHGCDSGMGIRQVDQRELGAVQQEVLD